MPYCTPTDVRATYPALSDPATYTDALMVDLIAEFEDIAERYRGIAYLPRTVTETLEVPSGMQVSGVDLSHAPVRSVSVLTFDTAALGTYQLDKTLGRVRGLSSIGLSSGSELVVTYSHGLDAPPVGIVRACKMYVRNCARADASGTSRDVLSQAIDGATTRYSTPDWDEGRPTGYLDVDRLLNSQFDLRGHAVA